jgi:uncharacterized protein YqgV (UPF0045/DUF77 family)
MSLINTGGNMFIAAQVSLYPLRQTHLSPAINDALDAFRERGLEVSPGAMSSLVSGDDEAFFEALKNAFRKCTDKGDVVMVLAISNACPVSR